MKKGIAILLTALIACGMVFAAGGSEKGQEIYFLNFKPEIADVYTKKVAPAFEAENPGYKLKVVTAASGTYEQTLRSEIAKSNPPVIFQTNGPIGLGNFDANAADLENTEFYKLVADKSMALARAGVVKAIPYAVEGYGIIYNDAIMRAYFALPNKAVAISSAEEITDFATLKAVVEDMQKNKDALGIQGVFASTSMSAGNQWRWQTHTVNVPLFFEFDEQRVAADSALGVALNASEISFKYGANFKNILDLYANNSVTPKNLLGAKSVDDSMAEFALGQCAMVQNGNWAAAQILGTTGNKVASEDIKFLPIYTGVSGEKGYGLCVGTENYLCINSQASAEAQKGADVFLTWLFSSETGKKLVSNDLMFITPFNSFTDADLPADPLSKQVSIWMNKPGISSIPWVFSAIPSEAWKDSLGSAILAYYEGKGDWAAVEKIARDGWASEWALKNAK